jgi:hypothetical protein
VQVADRPVKKMKILLIIIFCLTLFSCSNSDKPTFGTKEIDSTEFSLDYWFNNSKDIDSSMMDNFTKNYWLLFETHIIPDSIQIIDLSNSKGLIFNTDTSTTKRTVIKFNSDFTVTELISQTKGKWNIIHKKNINIQWDKPLTVDISGQYSIAYLKNERLHLFRGSKSKKNKTKFLLRKTIFK